MNEVKLDKISPKILKSPDQNKDQSYFLWQIKKKNLPKILFPIGDFENKTKVREFAMQNNLITATKKDSQGLCFVGQTNVKEMLWQILGQKTGLILTVCQDFYKENNQLENQGSSSAGNSANSTNLGKVQNQSQAKNQNQKIEIIKNQKTLEKIILQIDSKLNSKSLNKNQEIAKKTQKTNQKTNLIEYKILKKLPQEIVEKLVKLKKYFVIVKNENEKNKSEKNLEKNEIIKFYKILNLHNGAFVYTIGQRQGLNLSGGPWFVSLVDIIANTVFVSGEKGAKEEIYTKKILVKNLNWQNLPSFI